VHVQKLTWGNQRTTALLLVGKATVVSEKYSTRSALQVPFPHRLNTPYNAICVIQWKLAWRLVAVLPFYVLQSKMVFSSHSWVYRTSCEIAWFTFSVWYSVKVLVLCPTPLKVRLLTSIVLHILCCIILCHNKSA
jgi:hypothetical protein